MSYREKLLERDNEIVLRLIEAEYGMSQEEYDALIEEKAILETILFNSRREESEGEA